MALAQRLFWAGTVLYAVVVAAYARVLPDTVPMHFGGSGGADRFGTRTELLLVESGIGVAMVALFVATVAVMRRAPLQWVNVPHPEYWKTESNAPKLRRRMEADAWSIGTATMLLLTAVAALTARAALDGSGRLPAATPVVLVAYLAYVLGLCVWAVVRRYRPPVEPAPGSTSR